MRDTPVRVGMILLDPEWPGDERESRRRGLATVIEVAGLKKTFVNRRGLRDLVLRPFQPAKRTHALRGVDLEVRRGEIFGLLGPNGAGKTTLLKILSCLVLPDAGRATIDGIDVECERDVKRRIGLVNADERSFYWRLTARQNLRFFARLYRVPSKKMDSRINDLLSKVELSEAADRRFSDFSSGMKQRVAIARALLHDPPILFMDEPTRSLDPSTAKTLRKFMQNELNGRDGKTIVLATHNLREAELLADRVAVLARGRIRQVGPVAEVRRWGMDEVQYVLRITPPELAFEGPFRVGADELVDGTRRLTVTPVDGASLDDILREVHAAGGRIVSCDEVEADLETAFERILSTENEAESASEEAP